MIKWSINGMDGFEVQTAGLDAAVHAFARVLYEWADMAAGYGLDERAR